MSFSIVVPQMIVPKIGVPQPIYLAMRAVLVLGWLVGGAGLSDRAWCQQPAVVSKIAFGSCASQLKPCPIWGTIADYEPELLLLLGDTVYADLEGGRLKPSTPQRIVQAYEQLAALPDFQRLKQHVPMLATWDDHDYGNNDAGVEWEHKDAAAAIFHDFFGTPADSTKRQQRGIYSSTIFGPPGQRVQVIMLDTRYFRSELVQAEQPAPGSRVRPYIPAEGPDTTMLGEAQWSWLEEQLRQPAEVRILGSSIQVLSDEHPFETWGTMPKERERLFALIRKCGASGVVIVSGDRHLGDLSVDVDAIGYPLYDVTASGLNQANLGWRTLEPNRFRVAGLPYGNHFGAIEIDWSADSPMLHLQLRHEDGQIAVQARVPLSRLQSPDDGLPLPEGVLSAESGLALTEGATAVVQFKVASGRMLGERGRLLLNSQSDFRNARNFTVVVGHEALLGRFAGKELKNYLGQTIRVRGRVSLYNGAKQLEVDEDAVIEVVTAD